MKKLGIALLCVTFLIQVSAARAETVRMSVDPNIPQSASIVDCIDPKQLDCIESVFVQYKNGAIAIPTLASQDFPQSVDKTGQPLNSNTRFFSYPAGNKAGKISRFSVLTSMNTPTYKLDGGPFSNIWIYVYPQLSPGEVAPDARNCDRINILTCTNGISLNPDDKFIITLRTSWFKPVAIGGEGIDLDINYKKIPSGGTRWMLSGKRFSSSGFWSGEDLRKSATSEGDSMKADFVSTGLYFVLDHAGKSVSESLWNPTCADKGFTFTTSNAPMAGQLYWDYNKQSLVLNMYGPHLDPIGNPNLGFARIRIHKAWLECRFPGNTLDTAKKVIVEVVDQNGVAQVATHSVSTTGDSIYISASGFHFSSPSLVARADLSAGKASIESRNQISDYWPSKIENLVDVFYRTKSPNKNALEKSVICVKGKIQKKVSGLKPICPTGYKKK
jgi:hypothetical protein